MLLLKLPKFGVDIKGTAKIGLPLLVSILREISQAIEELLGLVQQIAKVCHSFPLTKWDVIISSHTSHDISLVQ